MSLPDKPIPQEDQDPLSQTRWPKQTVWHYTDAAGFAGIVEHNVLRASATAFMNDHQELRTGADLFKDLVDRHLSFVDPSVQVEFQRLVQHGLRNDRYRTYIACASAMSDSLTMWRNYTGEAGFAVALDARVPLRMRRQRPLTHEMINAAGFQDPRDVELLERLASDGSEEFSWTPVEYAPERQTEIAWQALRKIEAAVLNEGDLKLWGEVEAMREVASPLPMFKHRGFRDEAESRIVCGAPLHVDLMYLKHRPGRWGLVPYVEVGIPANPNKELEGGPEPMAKLPIIGVVVGPARYQDEALTGALELLRSHGRETVVALPSRIPFRS